MSKLMKIPSLQYLIKREVKDKFDFLYADKDQRFLQPGSIVFGGHSHACPKYVNNNFAKLLQYLKKEMRDEFSLESKESRLL